MSERTRPEAYVSPLMATIELVRERMANAANYERTERGIARFCIEPVYIKTILAGVEELLTRSGKPDVDRDFSIHASTDSDNSRCLEEEWQRDGRGLWAMRRCIHSRYFTHQRHCFCSWQYNVQPPSFDAVARIDGDTLDGLRAQNASLRDHIIALTEAREGLQAERDDLAQQLDVLRPGGLYAWKSKYEALTAVHERLSEILIWLDRRGGLGLDVHQRIQAALVSLDEPVSVPAVREDSQ